SPNVIDSSRRRRIARGSGTDPQDVSGLVKQFGMMRDATFDLNDFLEQLQQVKKMGPLEQVMEMIPGFSALRNKLPKERLGADEKALKKTEAIIYSMTALERHSPNVIDSSRRRRIARGSGTTVQDVNQLLNQFRQMQKMMKQLARGGMRGLMSMMR
ncbi:MAG: hypothetical protein HY677_02670, partial [Chloroflexi bacterium]|nr:hypothetical protein [Chloroflexota bacterium]